MDQVVLIDIAYYMIKYTTLHIKWIGWCRGNTVYLLLVDACSSLGQVISYPDGDFLVFLSPSWKLPGEYSPLAQHLKTVSITSVILQFDCV